MSSYLYHISPKESKDSILERGILTPNEVNDLIDKGELSSNVLGISFDSYTISNFPEYVSLLEDYSFIEFVAEQICFSRFKRYYDPNFMAIGYLINGEIKKHNEFINAIKVKEMNSEAFPSEALYHGRIPRKFIERCFATRTF
ncbi:MAG: hypothetical protein QT05_C0049G0047 [archaeon GW2011_AR13]|nr:MAG: hypothetical protein QT05_C0049G0047 [archaeon GW2011_AR13]HIG94537.1 hypothetical protein [Nanoarchaeota archaeon]HIH63026.1 hypothetical protein [Nanoarchaeota archaeon]HIJ09547.1 hypothetical protein [Nanoarchaeota archaeon]